MSIMMANILTEIGKYLPFINANAQSVVNGAISWIGGIGAGIIAIFLIISLIKDGIGIAKGSGDSSVFKIAGKIIFLIVIIGLIYLAMNYQSISGVGNTIANEAVNAVNEAAGQVFGGGGTP